MGSRRTGETHDEWLARERVHARARYQSMSAEARRRRIDQTADTIRSLGEQLITLLSPEVQVLLAKGWDRAHDVTGGVMNPDEEARQAMLAAGQYKVKGAAGQISFTCPACGRTSYHPTDVEEGYCGACHDWTRDCCDMHNRNCEPPSELCCGNCTESDHPEHRIRTRCVLR